MDNVCGKLNKMVVLIYADIANAELLMKELLTVMRSFHSILDLDNREPHKTPVLEVAESMSPDLAC